jgi:antitoxin YefM
MIVTDTLASLDFSRAKSTLSELMTEVVYGHAPRIVRRHRGKEEMVLVGTRDLVRFLDSFRFDTEVTIDAGEVTVRIPQLGVLGFGETLEEALEDLVEELRLYAADFFERASFFAETDRAEHAPWLLRFALTPPHDQLELLYEDSRQAGQPTA